MSERTCDKCGETKPRKAFWGVNRNIMKTCTACRQKEARRKRYLRAKKKAERAAIRREAEVARQNAKQKMKKSNIEVAVSEIERRIVKTEWWIKKYADKIAGGNGTKRTESALKNQYQKVEYYEDIKELMLEDASFGIDRPIEYYLENTFLLNKHGYPCVVTDDDPRSDRNGDNY
jgi:hypothetical protein